MAARFQSVASPLDMNAEVSANIRMYRLKELGDCFLITFICGQASSSLLIDCGSFRNIGPSIARLKAITAKIEEVLAGQALNVVVGTHQHNDHLSGFVHCETVFRRLKIQHVWLSWLDDPTDSKAQAVGRAHHNLKLQLIAVRDILLPKLKGKNRARPIAARSLEVLDDMLSFFGASAAAAGPPEVPAKGVKILKSVAQADPTYLRPGQTLDMPGLPQGSVRVHVLGPPRIEGVGRKDDPLYRPNPRSGESYDVALASAGLAATNLLQALRREKGISDPEEKDFPFNQIYKKNRAPSPALRTIMHRYRQSREAWRTIDDDWLEQAGALALYLDSFTNNSSLVLAIELVDSGKVLLFAADAQTGNWDSWKDVPWQTAGVRTDDLLARTVFYKVGHHASHNATLVEAFEKMNRPDLVALIPVHKKDPNITKPNGWKMPAKNLFNRLKEKTDHRVLQMDDVNPPDCNPAKDPAKTAWKRVGIKPKINDLSVEIEIRG
jgi:beta-lactamase superfamily II metal-dependent hydrolase